MIFHRLFINEGDLSYKHNEKESINMTQHTTSPYGLIYGHIFRDDRLSAATIGVYSALCFRARSTGTAWPSIATLCQDTNLKEQTVRKHLRLLEKCGYIKVEMRYVNKQQKSNLYHIQPNNEPPMTEEDPHTLSHPQPVNLSQGGDDKKAHPNNKREKDSITLEKQRVAQTLIDELNDISHENFRATPIVIEQLDQLMAMGYTVDDFKTVIHQKVPNLITRHCRYLIQPAMLFNKKYFDAYLQEAENHIVPYESKSKKIICPEWEQENKTSKEDTKAQETTLTAEEMHQALQQQLAQLRS